MSQYRNRILTLIEAALEPLGPLESTLDFGSGDGFFAHRLARRRQLGLITPVDVMERQYSEVRPMLYAGDRLPFGDMSFDLAYAVDVVHHCPNPMGSLQDLARCTRKYLLIKDHNYHSRFGKFALAVLDELGNRRFGIPSPYLYQRDWAWTRWLESSGFRRLAFMNPMACHIGLLGRATNGMQFMGLWVRQNPQ